MAASARRRSFPWVPVLVLLLLAGGGGWLLLRDGATANAAPATFTVKRGPLEIVVTEGGSLQSLNPTQVVSRVEGDAKILSLVPEGTVITPEDVAAGRVLVELDASDLRNKIDREKISVAEALAGVAQSRSALEILQNQNESDRRKADLDVRFARLDLDKYLGTDVARRAVESRVRSGSPTGGDAPAALVADARLGGEALQQRRKLQTDIDLAQEEVTRARDKLAWTEKLLAKGYVSAEEREADRLALRRQEVAIEQARTALDQFDRYEFGKQVETLLSALLEAEEAARRTASRTASALADAQADLASKEDKHKLERGILGKLEEQAGWTVIRATSPGMVVYATSEDHGGYGGGDQSAIQVGTNVHERQPILSIPDPNGMGVRVNVHESAMDKVKPGQDVRIRIDAFPDRSYRGRVERVSTLPDQKNRWMNPDLKVYATDIALESGSPDLRPGLSARVEIRVAEIPSTLAVPAQALAWVKGRPTVWVRTASGDSPRAVVTGASNDRMIEVREGLAEGEEVLLAPPKDPSGSDRGAPGGAEKPGGRGGSRGGRREGGDAPASGGGHERKAPAPAAPTANETAPATPREGGGSRTAPTAPEAGTGRGQG